MNNNFNIIRKLRERLSNNFYPVYHGPLVFDIQKQSFYRKTGYVAWPNTQALGFRVKEVEEKRKKKSSNGPYFAYPK